MTTLRKRPVRKIWLVAHPIGQFKEDVKTLAMQNNLKIVDAKYADQYPEEMVATKAPKLTSLTAELAAAKAAEAEEAAIEEQVRKEAAEEAEIERKYRLEVEVRARVTKEMADEAKKK